MKIVRINRTELLTTLRSNMITHVAEYNEAVSDYVKAALKITRANLTLAETGDVAKIAEMQTMPSPPSSYATVYMKAIRMLEMSVDAVIELDDATFSQLVLDDWSWKKSFSAMGALYKSF